jgi:hypothetical protein
VKVEKKQEMIKWSTKKNTKKIKGPKEVKIRLTKH